MLNHILKGKRVILASNSPRRQHLLKEIGLDFIVRPIADLDESYPDSLLLHQVPLFLAEMKADAFGEIQQGDIVITADTIVILEREIIAKPLDRDEAIAILLKISGKTHTVVTGVSLSSYQKRESFSVSTNVQFRKLSMEEIVYYIDSYNPYDKAASYGIQEWIGYVGVERVEGCFFNVMGLPVQKLYAELLNF